MLAFFYHPLVYLAWDVFLPPTRWAELSVGLQRMVCSSSTLPMGVTLVVPVAATSRQPQAPGERIVERTLGESRQDPASAATKSELDPPVVSLRM